MKEENILISWIGNNDLKITEDSPLDGDNGPLFTIVLDKGKNFFSEIHAIYTKDNKAERNAKIEIIQKRIGEFSKCSLHPVESGEVSDPNFIYKCMKGILEKITNKKKLFYNLTSGTPTMYAVQLLLSATEFPGVPLYTVGPDHVKEGKKVFQFSSPHLLPTLSADKEFSDNLFIAKVNEQVFTQSREKIARTNASVFILGESGVGKTWLARYIHEKSLRKEFYEVNCAEFSSDLIRSELFGHEKGAFTGADKLKNGLLEKANGGTLFLDEIAELPKEVQAMLLRALENPGKQVFRRVGGTEDIPTHVRIICATNKDIHKEMKEGRFREDLYFRLSAYHPVLQPFREYSSDDKRKLLEFLMQNINSTYSFSPKRKLSEKAVELILGQIWPGNIRELRTCLDSTSLLVDEEITEEDIQAQMYKIDDYDYQKLPLPDNVDDALDEIEKSWYKRALEECNNNQKKAAERLGINPNTFRSRWEKLSSL